MMKQDWLEATVVGRHQWTAQLVSLHLDAPLAEFQAGQYVKIALDDGPERVGRPYSLVNSPDVRPLEIHFTTVPEGALTSRLAALEVGARLWISARANGLFTLEQVVTRRHLWLFATGTGLGVYLSMLGTAQPWQRFERVMLVHGVRYTDELAYADRIAALRTNYGDRFCFIPAISRDAAGAGQFAGRITELLANGELERTAGAAITPEDSHCMMCGNAEMIKDARALLEERGLRRHKRSEPGHYTLEQYH